MAYAPVTFVDGVTPLNAANMNRVEDGVEALDASVTSLTSTVSTKVDKDAVEIASARLLAVKLLAGDAQQSFKIRGDGRHDWGPGGATAPDVNLYRGGVDILATDDQVQIANRLRAWNGAAGQVVLGGSAGTGNAQIFFGSALDCDITRSAADRLTTGDKFDPAAFNVPTKAGTPVDADVVGGAQDGDMIVDITAKIPYVRIAGVWTAVGGATGGNLLTVIDKTTGDFALTLAEMGALYVVNSAATVTAPNDATILTGSQYHFVQSGTGQITFAVAAGLTLGYRPGNKTAGQWATATMVKLSASYWMLTGNVVA